MTRSRCPCLVLCVVAAALLAGCLGEPASEPGGSPLPTAPTGGKPAGSDEPLLTVTPKAAAMVHQHVADLRMPEKIHLRVRVVPGGCQGFMHKLDLDADVSAEDRIFDSGGVSVVVFKRQVEMLRGAQVDYGEENSQRGFKVDNPNFKGDWTKKWLPLLKKETDVK
jgi:iron-sulfur cluster assembly accessory protein